VPGGAKQASLPVLKLEASKLEVLKLEASGLARIGSYA
jgi:hypothetical protein